MPNLSREEIKQATKEAIKEWLDEKLKAAYETIGKRLVHSAIALSLAALVYLILWTNGWHK